MAHTVYANKLPWPRRYLISMECTKAVVVCMNGPYCFEPNLARNGGRSTSANYNKGFVALDW